MGAMQNHDAEPVQMEAEQVAQSVQIGAMVAEIGRGKRRPSTTAVGFPARTTMPTTVVDTRRCSQCGTVCGVREIPSGTTIRLVWESCPCLEAAIRHSEGVREAALMLHQQYAEREVRADTPLEVFATQGITLERFCPSDIEPCENIEHPWDEMRSWLIQATQSAANRRTRHYTRALYLYSPTRGNGKTHAGVALLELAKLTHGWSIAVIEEERFAQQCWARDIAGQGRLIARFAQMQGLLLIDDMGKREPSRGLRNLYDALISRRAAEGGWTVITSNYTPAELLSDGIINESTFSRLGGLIDRHVLTINGYDHRLSPSR